MRHRRTLHAHSSNSSKSKHLPLKICAQRKAGRRKRARRRNRLSFFSFPWSLALCHQSLTCHSRFFAKNEAPEEGVVVLLLRSRLRVKQHKVNQETRKWASYKDAVRERCHSFYFVLKTPVSIVFLAIK